MSDSLETDSVETDAIATNSQASMGATLKSVREERNMTVEDVCAQLRISPHQVKALESDDFSALPEVPITRGFIRNYARLLEIDAEPLLQAYRATMPSATTLRPLTLKSENILISGKDKRPWLKYIVASFFIAASLGAWQFYMDYMPKLPPEQAAQVTESADTQGDEHANVPTETSMEHIVTEPLPIAALPAAEREEEAVTQAALTEDAAVASTASDSATTAGTSQQQLPTNANKTAILKLSFSQTSWVNVTDRNKKMIFDRIMPAGSEDTVEGEPPFEVVIGNAPGSKLIFNDKLVDLASHTKSNVARVTLE